MWDRNGKLRIGCGRDIGFGVERGALGFGNIDGMDLIGDLEYNNAI